MKMDKDTCYAIWQIGDKVAKCVPEIAPEIRDAISVVQNPDVELTEAQVKRSLSEIIRIRWEHGEFLSPVNADRLYDFFNKLSAACGFNYGIKCTFGSVIYYGNDCLAVSREGILAQLAA